MQEVHEIPTDVRTRMADLAISADGTPELSQTYTIEARRGIAVKLQAGQTLCLVNPSGHQVCDFWAFVAEDLTEHLSMPHLHTSLGSVFPKEGDALVTNLRRPLLTITKDTSEGVHDTIVACCDPARYRELGHQGYHDNCADNLRLAMAAIGLQAPRVPAPFNIWMNVPIAPDGSTHFAAPTSKPGDRIHMRADMPAIAVMSACPQDLTPVNGEGVSPDILQFEVLDYDGKASSGR